MTEQKYHKDVIRTICKVFTEVEMYKISVFKSSLYLTSILRVRKTRFTLVCATAFSHEEEKNEVENGNWNSLKERR